MTYPTYELDDLSLSLPITKEALRTAQRFANEQPTAQKAEQVRLNTLAVYVVNDYLQMMGIPTNLKASDSWNSVLRLCADVADLDVTGIGRLECRPYRSSQPTCYIPPEVWLDRVGYVVVEIDESLIEAKVLGFTQNVAREELPLSQLKPIEDLIERLHTPVKPRVSLSQWLVNSFEQGWEAVEALLASVEPDLAISFRSAPDSVIEDNWRWRSTPDLVIDEPELSPKSISRARLIDLGMQLAGHLVALVVEITPESDRKTNILLQLHPTNEQTFLPPLLQLTVLDENEAVFLEAQARNADNYIQLKFSGLRGETFSVRVALGDVSVVEDFAI